MLAGNVRELEHASVAGVALGNTTESSAERSTLENY